MLQKRLLTLAFLVLRAPALHAQESGDFTIILTAGDSAREAGDYNRAIEAYKKSVNPKKTFAKGDFSVEKSMYSCELYNLSVVLSRAGQQDSALKYLTRFTEEEVDESAEAFAEALGDPELVNLRKSAGWSALQDKIIAGYLASSRTPVADLGYAKALWDMGASDQAYYKDITIAEEKTGKSSSVVLALRDLKNILNKKNQEDLERLIAQKGWPKISAVGENAASAAFLVIQHADLKKQQKYLPEIERLCKLNEARWPDYALMYDRIQTDLGKPQRYGSQVNYNDKTQKYELLPLENAEKVGEWRKEVGLQPLAEYLKNWKIEWPMQPNAHQH